MQIISNAPSHQNQQQYQSSKARQEAREKPTSIIIRASRPTSGIMEGRQSHAVARDAPSARRIASPNRAINIIALPDI